MSGELVHEVALHGMEDAARLDRRWPACHTAAGPGLRVLSKGPLRAIRRAASERLVAPAPDQNEKVHHSEHRNEGDPAENGRN